MVKNFYGCWNFFAVTITLTSNVPSKSLLSVRRLKDCVSSGEYYLRQGSFGFLSKCRCSLKKKRSSLQFHPQFPYFIPKMQVFSKKKKKGIHFDFIPNFLILFPKCRCSLKKKKKGLHFDSLILDFLFCSRNQTLSMLMQRKHVLPKLTKCAAKRKYCARFPSLLRGRAGAQLRGNIVNEFKQSVHF